MVEPPLRMSRRTTRELIGLLRRRADSVEALSRNERQTLPQASGQPERSERVSRILVFTLHNELMRQVPEEPQPWVRLVRLLKKSEDGS
jgi:hypothetical protein